MSFAASRGNPLDAQAGIESRLGHRRRSDDEQHGECGNPLDAQAGIESIDNCDLRIALRGNPLDAQAGIES